MTPSASSAAATASETSTSGAQALHPIVAEVLEALSGTGTETVLAAPDFMRFRNAVHERPGDRKLALHLVVSASRLAEAGARRAGAQLEELASICFREITQDAAHRAGAAMAAHRRPSAKDPLARVSMGVQLRGPRKVASAR